MADAAAIIGMIGGVVGILSGGGLIGLWRVWRQEHREEQQGFFASYEKSIATLEKLHQRETDPAEKEAKRQKLETVEDEYLEQQEAYRQNCALRQSAPRGALTAERPLLPEPVLAKLRELLEKAEPLSPALLTARDHSLRGNALFKLGRYEEALDSYNRSLELRPDDPDILHNRGIALSSLKRPEEALADFNRSLDLRPDNPDVLNNRGIALSSLKRHEEALADYNRALKLRPDYALTMYNIACLYSVWGRYDDSLEWLEKAIARDTSNRGDATGDEDFAGLRADPEFGPRFEKLIEGKAS